MNSRIPIDDLPDSFNAGNSLIYPTEQPEPKRERKKKVAQQQPAKPRKAPPGTHPKPDPPTETLEAGYEHWTRKQAAAYLNVTPQGFDCYVRDGLISPVPGTGGEKYSRPRFRIQDVISLVKPKPGRPWHKEKGREQP